LAAFNFYCRLLAKQRDEISVSASAEKVGKRYLARKLSWDNLWSV
jgi:hypothetical protein